MKVTWKDLSFLPGEEALKELRNEWSWLLPKSFGPVMASTLGDVFFQQGSEAVFWLNTGTADVTQVAASRSHFLEVLKTEQANEWFMPALIQELKEAGKLLKPDYCYSYLILPIFAEGKYEVANLNPVPAKEHFGLTGTLHRQLKDTPDGTPVRINVRK
jgi:hypothetical protein